MINPGLMMLIVGATLTVWPDASCHAKGVTQGTQWQQGFIEGSIRSNPHLREFEIEVVIEDDHLALEGSVDSTSARALAEQIAINVSKVARVDNRLKIVKPATLASRRESQQHEWDKTRLANVPINNKVMSRILGHAQTRTLNIEAQTHNRVVTVRGTVNNGPEKELVYWLVKNTDGVLHVVDMVEVAGPHQIQAGL